MRTKILADSSDFDFWSPQTAQEAFRDEQQIIRTGQPMIGKIEKLTHPDGRVSWDYTTKLPLKDSQGRPRRTKRTLRTRDTRLRSVSDERIRLSNNSGDRAAKLALAWACLMKLAIRRCVPHSRKTIVSFFSQTGFMKSSVPPEKSSA
jgi:hypothetical protein